MAIVLQKSVLFSVWSIMCGLWITNSASRVIYESDTLSDTWVTTSNMIENFPRQIYNAVVNFDEIILTRDFFDFINRSG